MKQLKFITKLRGLIVLVLALMVSGNAWGNETLTDANGNTIDASKTYRIKSVYNSNYLTAYSYNSGYYPAVQALDASSNYQKWQFVISGSGSSITYALKNVGTSTYVKVPAGNTNQTLSSSAEYFAADQTSTNGRTSATTGEYCFHKNGDATRNYYLFVDESYYDNGKTVNKVLGWTGTQNKEFFTIEEVEMTYSVTVNTAVGGTVSASSTSDITAGTEITLSNTPSTNFALDSYIVTDADGNAVTVTDGKFTMPESDVTVSAIFNLTTSTITPGDRPWAIMDPNGTYLDISTTTTDDNDGGACINRTSTAYPFNFVGGSYTGGWIIKSAATSNSYLAPQTSGTDLKWSTIARSTAYTWTIEGVNSEFTIAREDGKYIASQTTAPMYCNNTTSTNFSLVPLYIIWPENGQIKNGSVGFEGYQAVLPGTEVTLTNTPSDGFILTSYNVIDADGTTITVTDGKFTMPAKDVHVTATFTADHVEAVTGSGKLVGVGSTTSPFKLGSGYTGAIEYSSADENMATVNENGVVTAKTTTGTVEITATPKTAQTGYVLDPVTVTVTISTGHVPSIYSTTWTKANKIYLYNKGTGLYLGTGGRWGTEGLLKATGLPMWLSAANSTEAPTDPITGLTMYSKDPSSGSTQAWGFVASEDSYDPIKTGLYNDQSTGYVDQTFTFTYNSDDNSYSINRESQKAGIAITYKDNGKTYYLAPKVNTLSATTLQWSTSVYYWTWDSENSRIYVGSNAADGVAATPNYIYYNSGAIGLTQTATDAATCAVASDSTLTIGGYYLEAGALTLKTKANTTNAATGARYLEPSHFYLTQTGGTSGRANIVTEHQYSGTIPDIARWFIVTQQDLIDDFDNATASDAEPKEATFYIGNNDFSRNVTLTWQISDDKNTWTTPYTRLGNSLYNIAGPTETTNSVNGVSVTSVVEDVDNGEVDIDATSTLGGSGEGYKVLAADTTYAGIPADQYTYYHAIYAGYYNCRILSNGTTTARKIYQQLTDLRQGYYTISCDGYIYNPSDTKGTATLYAKRVDAAGDDRESNSVALKENATYENMTKAGITFYNDGKTSDYRNYVTVYVEEGETLEIGVSVSGGTWSGDATDGDGNTFAEIDAFQLQYTGDTDFDIVLDEDFQNTADHKYSIGGKTVNYINAQAYDVEGHTSRTMYLKHAFKANQWNSLVLPVAIPASSIQSAFGSDVKLVKFDNCTGNLITFSTASSIEPGVCYLIKPSSITGQTTGTYSTKVARLSSETITVEASEDQPVFMFKNVEFTTPIYDDKGNEENIYPEYSSQKFIPTNNENDGYQWNLAFMGTYFFNQNALGYGSYALNAANGNWVRYANKGDLIEDEDGNEPGDDEYVETYAYNKTLPVKGFRCWIGQEAGQTIPQVQQTPAKMLTVIDGEIIDPTDIAEITTDQMTTISDNRVYNISGQLIGTRGNINNLPKGIYISNGKKYIVK